LEPWFPNATGLGRGHYGVENKLINLAKSLSKKLKTGQDWNSDYKVE